MLNYTFDKEKSKTFVKYYKEKEDKIVVKYADSTTIEVDNNDEVKNNLNKLEERQLERYLEDENIPSKWKGIGKDFLLLMAFSGLITLMGTGVIGGLGCIFFGFKAFEVTFKISALSFLIPLDFIRQVVPAKVDSLKFDLFSQYKTRINGKIDEKNKKEEEKINTNTLNPVKPKRIKNLCINDVNFMNYFQVKKMTREIDKEEKRIDIERKKEELNRKRYADLGLNKDKVLTKKRY